MHDLPAADAAYHVACNINFRTGRSPPKHFDDGESESGTWKRKKIGRSGRPKDVQRHKAFLMTMDYFKNNDDETLSMKDLRKNMGKFLEGNDVEPYGFTHMKNEMKQHCSETVMISELQGKDNIVTLHSTASQIIDNFHQKSKQESDKEKRYMIETAAKLIKQDIKDIKQKNESPTKHRKGLKHR